MQLFQLLRLQTIYVLSALIYNIISIILILFSSQPLTTTSPYLGVVVMVVYALFILLGRQGKLKLYRIAMGIAVIVL